MKKMFLVGCLLFVVAGARAEDEFLKKLAGLAAEAEKNGEKVIEGKDGWLFFPPELRAMSVGPFWGEAAEKASNSSKSEYADPLPAILDFNDQLKKAGIELLLVPVPGKAAVYPEKLGGSGERPDRHHMAFYKLLEEKGVSVFDPYEVLHENRDAERGYTYCRTDTHWSAWGIKVVADEIAKRYKDHPLHKGMDRREILGEVLGLILTGDLALLKNEANPEKESISIIRFVDSEGALAEMKRESPILLIGDSHTLVFHDPNLHARGAGLPDHLAAQFGTSVDLEGTRGSGATATRIALLRRRDNLEGKKLVIWCFSMREFTESFSGWRKVPVIR